MARIRTLGIPDEIERVLDRAIEGMEDAEDAKDVLIGIKEDHADIQKRMASLNDERAAAVKEIDKKIEALKVKRAAAVKDVDAKINAVKTESSRNGTKFKQLQSDVMQFYSIQAFRKVLDFLKKGYIIESFKTNTEKDNIGREDRTNYKGYFKTLFITVNESGIFVQTDQAKKPRKIIEKLHKEYMWEITLVNGIELENPISKNTWGNVWSGPHGRLLVEDFNTMEERGYPYPTVEKGKCHRVTIIHQAQPFMEAAGVYKDFRYDG